MQASDDTLRQLVMAYEKSLSPDPTQRRAAEDFMKSIQAQPGFAAVVMKLLTATGLDNNVLQIAAIHFKNFVRNNWRPSEGSTDVIKISDAEREQIKNTIVDLMVAVPPAVQRQLSETLSIISQSDFPQKWQNLLPALISKLNTQDPKILYGVLETANSIFKRYQHQFKSDAILEELKYILELFQEPLLKLFLSVNQLIEQNKSNPQVLPSLFQILHVILGLFYSLSFVDLPEYFEDHMKEWMEGFNRYLAFEPQYPELVSTNDEEEGVLQKVQAAICENINLYTTKYEEEFASFLPTFVGSVWNLLVKVGPQMKNDALVCSGMGFLTSVATSVHFALFNEQGAVQSIVEKIIIPNIKLREDDEEMFEMNPQEYIRRDIEGSDTDTRRRMASELIKGLRKQFELPLTQLFTAYIGTLLEQYKSNPEANWQAKDAALYLVTALTVSAATAAGGVTKTNQFVDVVNVFATQVLPELQSAEVAHDILKADAFKFVTTFRNQLPREAVEGVFGLAVTSLESDSYVVQTYASIAVERLLLLKGADNAPVLGRAQLKAFLQPLVTNIFKVLSEAESKENSYIMKSLVRVIATSGEEVAPIAEALLRQLVSTLGGIYKNVGNVNFAHWLFEAIAALITAVCPGNAAAIGAFEGQLFPAFQAILAEDVTELGPYVFQVLAYMLELRGTGAQQAYVALLPSLLVPVLWQRAGYQPPLVRLLQAYLNNAPQLILAQGHLQPILGVFQKLLSSSQSDHLAFFLLESIFLSLPFDQVQPFVASIFQLVFARIQSSKTLKIIRSFIVFLAFFIGKHGASTVLQAIDNVQPNLFMMVMSSLWLPNIQKVSGLTERKACAIAMIKLLTDCPALLGETYFSLWSKILAALMAVLELPQDESAPADVAEEEVDVDIAQASHASFETLMHARKKDVDPFKDVDPKKLLAFSLQRLSQAHPGKFGALVQQSLTPEALAALQSYFVAAGLNQPYLA